VRVDDANQDFRKLSGLGPTFGLLLEKQLGLAFYRENIGTARNYGTELLVRRTTKRWMGLVSYTLAVAERKDGPTSPLGWRPFDLDQRHNLNVAGSMLLGPGHWRLGARVQYVSGMPYSPMVGIGPDGEPLLDPYAERLPAFFRFDLRVDRVWQRCWGAVNFYADIQNVTNRRNVEGREPNDFLTGDDDIPGLPIMPFIGVEFIPR
jgi:outer membrane receptor protein involved in Fe transport